MGLNENSLQWFVETTPNQPTLNGSSVIFVADGVYPHDLDILIVSESWMQPNIPHSAVAIAGCNVNRADRRSIIVVAGSGVPIYIEDTLKFESLIDNSSPCSSTRMYEYNVNVIEAGIPGRGNFYFLPRPFCANQVVDVPTRSNGILDLLFVSVNIHICESGFIALSTQLYHMIFCNINLVGI